MTQAFQRLRGSTGGFRFKAVVGVASLLVMISVLLCTLFVLYLERHEEVAAGRLAATLAPTLASAAGPALASDDPAGALQACVSPLRKDPRLARLVVRRGPDIVFRHGRPQSPLPGATAQAEVLDSNGHAIGSVEVAIGSGTSGWSELRWRAAVISFGMIVFGIAGTMFLVGRILSPIHELVSATRRLADGDFEVRLPTDGDGEVAALAHHFNEMTDRLRAATQRRLEWQRELEMRVEAKTREIEETRQHLEKIVENVGASILVADVDGSIVSANTHTQHLFGAKPEFSIGRNLSEFGSDGRSAAVILAQIAAAGGPVVTETEVALDDDHVRSLLVTHTLLRDGSGRAAGLMQIAKDITQLKAMERRLVSSERLSAMGEMAGEIGHELNNYLMAIGGRAELIGVALQRGADARSLEKVKNGARIIAEQVAEMRRLTDGLLESARKETSPKPMDLNELVGATVDFVKPQNKFDLIEFEVRSAPGPLDVFADPQQLRQVVLNLLSNAGESIGEFRATGGRIVVETVRQDDGVCVRVTDNGAGMPDSVRRRIFEPHFTTKERGHGFGLAVCHRVIENHRGRIEVRSKPGEGATFVVYLPGSVNPGAVGSPASGASADA